VVQLYRTARKRNGAVWGVSQAIEDFTGTTQAPNAFGAAILKNTTIKIIGADRKPGRAARVPAPDETTLNEIKNSATRRRAGRATSSWSLGRSETTHTLRVVFRPLSTGS